jgi:hypothetical protein
MMEILQILEVVILVIGFGLLSKWPFALKGAVKAQQILQRRGAIRPLSHVQFA